MERLQKVIASIGYTSRRKAEELIIQNRVKVNGILVNKLGTKINVTDIISIDDQIINKEINKIYYLLNKPKGVICSVKDNKNRKTIIDLIDTNERIYPIGRLDYNTTGLIILTNDGMFTSYLMHPKNKITKTYIAKINGILNKQDFQKLRQGILIDNRKVIIDHFKVKEIDNSNNKSLIEITIHEGRNHIIKKIFKSFNKEVLKLHRSKIAFLTDINLKCGEYRKLSVKEIKTLYSLK